MERNGIHKPTIVFNTRRPSKGLPDSKTKRQPGESFEDYMKRWNAENEIKRTTFTPESQGLK